LIPVRGYVHRKESFLDATRYGIRKWQPAGLEDGVGTGPVFFPLLPILSGSYGNPQAGSPEFAWPRPVDPVEPLDRDSFIARRGRWGNRLFRRVRTDCKPRANNGLLQGKKGVSRE